MKLFVISFAPGAGYSARNRRDWRQAVLAGIMTLVLSISLLAVILAGVIFVDALNYQPEITLVPTSGVVEIPAHINARHAVLVDMNRLGDGQGGAATGGGWLDGVRPTNEVGQVMDGAAGF